MSSGTILAQLKGVTLTLGGAPLFDGVDLALVAGERACLIGANGAGKSTLLRMLTGEQEPDSGIITLANGAHVAVTPQVPDFGAHETLLDYVEAGIGAGPIAPYLASANLESFGLDPARATAKLSGGEARRAGLARMFAADADILLLDEPTNHLDLPGILDLEARLSAFRGACLVISHDRRFLERVSTVTYWLRQRRVIRNNRGFDAFDTWAEEVETEEARTLARVETHLAAEERWLARGVTGRRARNEGRRRKLFALRAEQSARASAAQKATAVLEASKGAESGRIVIEARSIAKSFQTDGGDRELIRDFSLKIMRGDRVGIIGPNGAGKTTLLEILLQRQKPDAGEVRHGANLAITYLDQKRDTLDPNVTIWDALCPLGGDQVLVRGQPRHVAAYARDFLFQPGQLRQPIGALSGGERNRLLLAIALAQPANLLVLDEPTNDLDMETQDALEEMLASYDGAILLVSHDRAFLDGVATQIVGAVGQARWVETPGGFADFEREHGGFSHLPNRSAKAPQANTSPAVASPAAAPRRPRKLSFKEERRLGELEAALPRLERELATLEARLADPNLFAKDPPAFERAAQDLANKRAEKDASETEWLELDAKRDALARGD
jgi:ATP-binding cassette subfamily F protein uup